MSWGGVGQTLGAPAQQPQAQDLKLPMPPGDSVSSLCFAPSDTLNLVAAGSWDGSVRACCVLHVLGAGCAVLWVCVWVHPSIDGSTAGPAWWRMHGRTDPGPTQTNPHRCGCGISRSSSSRRWGWGSPRGPTSRRSPSERSGTSNR